ncbi:MAG: hypothetical protein WA726_01635 [Acidimicrobiia bacterium]
MIDSQVRGYVEERLDQVPLRSGDLSSVVLRGQRRRRARRGFTVAVAALLVALFVGPMFWLFRPVEQPLASGSGSLQLTDGFTVGVSENTVESEGAMVYEGLLGPTPVFDTSRLGTEIPLTLDSVADLVVPPKVDLWQANALNALALVYLGDINGAQIALQLSHFDGQDHFCVFFGNGTDITGGGICGPSVSSHPVSGFAADPAIGGWVVWTKLAEETSVVRMELVGGSSYWQRPRGRTVFFNLPDHSNLDDVRLTTFTASGDSVITEQPVSQIQIQAEEDMRSAP